jgi:hypothetical protein
LKTLARNGDLLGDLFRAVQARKRGQAKLLEGRGSAFAIWELLPNCWDEQVTKVKVTPLLFSPIGVALVGESSAV